MDHGLPIQFDQSSHRVYLKQERKVWGNKALRIEDRRTQHPQRQQNVHKLHCIRNVHGKTGQNPVEADNKENLQREKEWEEK